MTEKELEALRKKVMVISECVIHIGAGVLILSVAFLIVCFGWWLVH